MIRWSFWVDAWEHPFNSSLRRTGTFIPDTVVKSAAQREHISYGPWKGPPPGPIKPGPPKYTAEELAAMAERRQWMKDNETAEYWWNDPDQYEKYHPEEHERDQDDREDEREHDPRGDEEYMGGEPESQGDPEHPWQDMNYGDLG